MAVKSDFGDQILVTNEHGVTYDLNKDYTKAIEQASTPEEKEQLETQRKAKVQSAAYGGVHKEDANKASLGGEYNTNVLINNRTDNSYPITTYSENTAPKYDVNAAKETLKQSYAAAQQQQANSVDYATQQAVNELTRAEQDAAAVYQEQRNQVDLDEAKARDNQALYAERRGDRGGIAAAQYDSIANTAAKNRLAVNQAQTKLATDTARQIADLRAQGEYEKANSVLQLTQQYLTQLMSLEQWGAEYGLSTAQFQASLNEWQKEFAMAEANITGVYNGQQTLAYKQYLQGLEMDEAALTGMYKGQQTMQAKQAEQSQLIEMGKLLLQYGITPSPEQLKAMGLTSDDAQTIIKAGQLGGDVGDALLEQYGSLNAALYANGITTYEEALDFLVTYGGLKSQHALAQELADLYVKSYLPNQLTPMRTPSWVTELTSRGYANASDLEIWNNTKTQTTNGKSVTVYYIPGFTDPWLNDDELDAAIKGGLVDVIPNTSNGTVTFSAKH